MPIVSSSADVAAVAAIAQEPVVMLGVSADSILPDEKYSIIERLL